MPNLTDKHEVGYYTLFCRFLRILVSLNTIDIQRSGVIMTSECILHGGLCSYRLSTEAVWPSLLSDIYLVPPVDCDKRWNPWKIISLQVTWWP